jgi:hypothetical protein
MADEVENSDHFEDVTPNPRILAMLGRIPFEPWQCLAELIDNSIDALLSAQEENPNWIVDELGQDSYPISITLPSHSNLDSGRGVVTVIDRGPGMTLDQLRSAVKAGFSGNDPTNKLGLFGMGFNIATAKLGKVTTVTTARKEDNHWTCLRIDFDEMMRTGKFRAPRWTEPKEGPYPEEEHGTIIEISSLDRDECRPLVHSRGTIKKKLGKVYANIMTDKSVVIRLNDDQEILPRKHCIWGPNRYVTTSAFGRVRAVIPIDVTLPSESFCKACWGWTTNESVIDEKCPLCFELGQITERERRIHGWIGIQRFLDQDEFGIDLIRNGRVIEILNKDFFQWPNDFNEDSLEYPIDNIHWGGRIVGEIHLDFIGVSYTKDSFEKTQYNWQHTVEVIRGTSPLRPLIATRHNLPVNDSPLAKLYSGYRKASPPGTKHLVPGNPSNPSEGDNSTAKRWAQNFWDGDQEYQTDEKWHELVLAADRARRSTGSREGPSDDSDDDDTGDDDDDAGNPFGPEDDDGTTTGTEDHLVLNTGLSQAYEIRPAGTAPIHVRAYEDTRRLNRRELSSLPPIRSEYIQAGEAKLIYHKKHPALVNFSEDVLDYILMELAAQFSIRAGQGSEWSVTRCYSHLKETYQAESKLDVQALASHATLIISELREHLANAGLTSSRENLSDAEIEILEDRVLQTLSSGPEIVDQLLHNGKFIQFMDNKFVVKCFENNPEAAMDGRFFAMPYSSLPVRQQDQAVSELARCLKDAINIIEVGQSNIEKDKLWKMRTKASIAYLQDQVV